MSLKKTLAQKLSLPQPQPQRPPQPPVTNEDSGDILDGKMAMLLQVIWILIGVVKDLQVCPLEISCGQLGTDKCAMITGSGKQ